MNVNAKVSKKLGEICYKSRWTYDENEFEVENIAEVFLSEFISYGENSQLGLDGEFAGNIKVVEIFKDEILENVYEFVSGKINLG